MPRRYKIYPKLRAVDANTKIVVITSPEDALPVPVVQGKTYADGVEAACKRVAKDARLAVKMTSGDTLGETIAQQIERDLL